MQMKEEELWQGFSSESGSEVAVLRALHCARLRHVSSTPTANPITSDYALPMNQDSREYSKAPMMSYRRDHPVRQECPDCTRDNGARASGQECRIS